MTRKLVIVGALAALLAIVSCTDRGLSEVEQRSDTALARQLNGFSRPLIAGEEGLVAALPMVSVRSQVLQLTTDGARPLTRPLRAEDLCDERYLVLYHDLTGASWLLDPRTSTVSGVGDEVVFCRALPIDHETRLGAFRCTLRLSGDEVQVANHQVSPDDHDCRMPVWVPSRGVVYEKVGTAGRRDLWLADEQGARPLLGSSSQGRQPQALPGGRITFLAEGASGWSRFSYDFSAKPAFLSELPLVSELPLPAEPRLRPAIRKRGDAIEPVLLRIPERIDLAEAVALVEAQDPVVNRARALLAVTLVEASQAGLARWPTLAVGLFTTPITGILVDGGGFYTGDYLAEGLSRGVVGLVQPLLDFSRNAHLEAAALERVCVAADAYAEVVQRRCAEAAIHALSAERHRDLVTRFTVSERCWRERAGIAARRTAAGYGSSSGKADAARGLALASAAVSTHRDLAAYHRNHVMRACGIDQRIAVEVATGAAAWGDVSLPDLQTLVAGALVDRPRLRAARRELTVAFHVEQAGADLRPSLSLQGSYGQTRDSSYSATDDYVSLGLSGELPLAAVKAAGLHRQRSIELATALRAAEEVEAEAVAGEVEMAWLELQRARGEYTAAFEFAATADERLRILGLRAQGIDDDGTANAEGLAAARCLQAEARAAADDAGWQVAERLAATLAAAGRAAEIAPRIAQITPAQARATRTSTWLWRTGDIQPGGPALASMETAAIDWRVGRIALFMGGGTDPFATPAARAGLDRFAGRCRHRGVALWALLGDPAWFDAADDDIRAEVARAAALATVEDPLMQGVELDIEPHAMAGWSDPGQHAVIAARYVRLVAVVRDALPKGIPLWLNAPPQLVTEMGDALAPYADGVVVLCYAQDAAAVSAAARSAAKAWSKTYSLALELMPTAEGANLSALGDDALRALMRDLVAAHAGPRFAGIALHDLSAVAARSGTVLPEIR